MLKSDKSRKIRSSGKFTLTPPAFLLKTYEILENSEYSEIISWNKEGDAFIVKKQNEFAEKILPKFFKHNNFQSFVRQLNMYDFHKSRQENHENIFKHALFKKGHKELLKNIKRKASFENFPINSSLNNTQLAPLLTNGQEFDIERYNKDYRVFMQELINLKNKQEDLQHVTTILIQQNNEILSENKILWNELLKNRDKKDKKFDKFFQMLMHFFINNSTLPQLKTGSVESPKIITKPSKTDIEEESKSPPYEPKNIIDSLPDFHRTQSSPPPPPPPSLLPFSKEKIETTLCNFTENENQPENEKFIKKLLKKLKNKNGKTSEPHEDYKFSSFLDNYYEKNVNLLQNLMKYMNNSSDKTSDLFTKLLGKRNSKPHFDISNSLKYLDDSIFSKRKKLKKMKTGKKEEINANVNPALFFQNNNADFNNYPSFFSNFNKKEGFSDLPNVKLEQQPAFGTFFNQPASKMLTNYPNNPSNFGNFSNSAPNFTNNNNFNDIFNYNNTNNNFGGSKLENNPNFLNSPFLDQSALGLSRKNSVNCQVDINEEFQNFENNNNNGGQFNFGQNLESPIRNYGFGNGVGSGIGSYPSFINSGTNNLKDDEIDDKRSNISLNLDKLEG